MDWRRYPFRLVAGDDALEFPAAEGDHPDQESDTWFLAGQLNSANRSFAFLTIVNKNRPGNAVVADFYTMALFDLDTGDYGTYTDYDMPPANLGEQPRLSTAAGHLDLRYRSGAGTASWTTCRDRDGDVRPYTYQVSLVGRDHAGRPMRLDLDVSATRAPVPLGASAYNGRISCFGQDDTYSYFHTGMAMTGTLRWGDIDEHVTGTAGVAGEPLPVARVAHHQPGQRRRPQHLAAVRSHPAQCADPVFRGDRQLSGRRTGMCGGPRRDGFQPRPVAGDGTSASAAVGGCPLSAGPTPDHLRRTAVGSDR